MKISSSRGSADRTSRKRSVQASHVVQPHWLRALKPRRKPYDLVALGTVGEWLECDPREIGSQIAEARKYALREWALAGIPASDQPLAIESGTDPGELWQSLIRLARTRHNLVIVGEHIWPVVAAINTWKMVDEGILSLSSPRSKPEALNRAIYITYGSPTLITVWLAKSRDKLTFADAGNWGWGSYDGGSAARDAAFLADDLGNLRAECQALGMADLELCASSIGYRYWREHHLAEKSVLVHRHPQVLEMEREAYYAGRCECRGTGTPAGRVYRADVTSAYGALAQDIDVPVSLRAYYPNQIAPMILSMADPGSCLADVSIESPAPFAPLRADGKICYPIGRYRTVLAGPELAEAFRRGIVSAVHRYARYRMAPALRTWAAELLGRIAAARAAGDARLTSCLKLAINAGIGRIGARWRRWLPTKEPGPDWRWGQWIQSPPGGDGFAFYRALAGARFFQDDQLAAPDSVIAIPAWIASACRVGLARLIDLAGPRNIYYTDTDSIWCNQDGYSALPVLTGDHRKPPGALVFEAVYDSVQFGGPKVYCCDGQWTVPSVDVEGPCDMLAGADVARNLGLADSLKLQAPPGGHAKVRKVRVRCCTPRRMKGKWKPARPIRLDVP